MTRPHTQELQEGAAVTRVHKPRAQHLKQRSGNGNRKISTHAEHNVPQREEVEERKGACEEATDPNARNVADVEPQVVNMLKQLRVVL
jgi:hypothetical protein